MELSLADARELLGAGRTAGLTCSFAKGQSYLIRTVTFYYTGRVSEITDTDIVLQEAAWIASTGRFHDCLKNGTFDEVEPFISDVIVPRGAIVDATFWAHSLPRSQK